MTLKITLSIDDAGDYVFKKGGSTNVHKKGHISLLNESQPIDIEITLDSPTVNRGYAFLPGVGASPADGTQALFIADDPAMKGQGFNDFGQFYGAQVKMAGGARVYNVLSFSSANTDGDVYYYQLNFVDGPVLAIIDPILINRC